MSISAGSARGQCAPGWSVFVTSLTRPVSLLRWQWICTSKPPLLKGGASAPPRRGDKRLAGFYIGLFLWKSLLCESLRCLWYQLPLAREPCGQCPRTMRTGLVCIRYFPDPPGIVTAVAVGVHLKAPLAKGGCLGTAEAGGLKACRFLHWLISLEKPPL